MKDKKKLIVVAALALVIVGVGVFQFVLGSSSPAPAPVASKKEEKKAQNPAEKVDPPKNPLLVADLQPRDPFTMPNLPDAQPKPKPTPTPTPTPPRATYDPPAQPLPSAGIEKGGGFAPVQVQSVPEAQFAFTLAGVMLGEKPMAVFADAQGNQRLVLLGGSLDPDSKVISIDKDAVTVRFHGKTLRLTVEGKPNGK